MKIIHLFPNGQVERGTGKPGYRWVPAYSQVHNNCVSMSLPRREWYAMANRDGEKCKFHKTKEEALTALEKDILIEKGITFTKVCLT